MYRQLLFWGAVICFSYFAAFMETLTISSIPYYSFENCDMVSIVLTFSSYQFFHFIVFVIQSHVRMLIVWQMEPTLTLQAYTVGSAFYGIYFLVSFPMFFYVDENIDSNTSNKHVSIVNTVVSSFGCGMMVLCLLDFVRLYLNVPLTIQVQQM